jgi:hypothetical protein
VAPSGFVDFTVFACAAVVAHKGVQITLSTVEVRNMVADSGAVCVGVTWADHVYRWGDAPSLTISSSVIKSNTARTSGAAVVLVEGEALRISGTRFEANRQQSKANSKLGSSAVLAYYVTTLVVDKSSAFVASMNGSPYPCGVGEGEFQNGVVPATVLAFLVKTANFSNVSFQKNQGTGLIFQGVWVWEEDQPVYTSLRMQGCIFTGNVGKGVGGILSTASTSCLSTVTFEGNIGQEVMCGDWSIAYGGTAIVAGTHAFSGNRLTFKKNVAVRTSSATSRIMTRAHSLFYTGRNGGILTNTILDTPATQRDKYAADVQVDQNTLNMCRTTFQKVGSRVPTFNHMVQGNNVALGAIAVCPTGSQGSYKVTSSLLPAYKDCNVCTNVGTKTCATQPKWQDWLKGLFPSNGR